MPTHDPCITRRTALGGLFAAVVAPRLFAESSGSLSFALEEIQKKSAGRLGCAVYDSATGKHSGIRLHERFPMCSTSKLPSVAYVLHRVDIGKERLDRRIVFSHTDLIAYSPITSKRVGSPGMTIAEICQAAITVSDNTAANLLLETYGGPPALTKFLRSIGDPMTRLDRTEPTLNEATPGDPRDTTTPAAMLQDLRRFVAGKTLTASSRAHLVGWMAACQTGGTSLKADMPRDWKVGDKTGSGGHGSTNDVAVVWPPNRRPIFVTAYLTECSLAQPARYAILADVGKAVVASIRPAGMIA